MNLAASRSNAWSNGWGTTFWNSELTAGKLLSVDSGRDWALSGAKATGETVSVRVGSKGAGNLSIVSPQDESFYQAKEQSFGFNVSIPVPGLGYGAPSLGISASGMRLLAENESIKQQSSVVAGTGGFDVRVNGHTHLLGAAIASKADAWRNYFETQTLTHQDVVNRDVASGKSWSVSLNISAPTAATATTQALPGGVAGSGIGFARLDTNETFTTKSSVAGTVTLTRPDLQAAKLAALKAAERDPLLAARADKQSRLNDLLWNEPPRCDNCMIESLPTAPDVAVAGVKAGSSLVSGSVSTNDSTTASTTSINTPNKLTPPIESTDTSYRWTAWQAAVLALRSEINGLSTRISAVDAKVHQSTATLSTNPNGLHQPLLHTFDKTRATQELRDGVAVTAAFGKAAYKAAGDYAKTQANAAQSACGGPAVSNCPEADKWRDGGTYKALLHGVVGSVAAGGVGAMAGMTAELSTPYLRQALIAAGVAENSTLYNLLMPAAKTLMAGGLTGAAGAAVAFNADANNRQLHPIEIDIIRREAANFARQLKSGLAPTQAETDAAEARLAQEAFRTVQFGAPGAPDTAANAFLHQPAFKVQLPSDPTQLPMGIGYAFYATPAQRANPNMYADLVVNDLSAWTFYRKNNITQPTAAQAETAIARYQAGRDKTTQLTNLAGLMAGSVTLAPMAPTAITACLANITLCGIGAAELAAGSALGPTGMGASNMAARAGFKNVLSAEQANAQWIATKAGNTAAWTDGTAVFQGEIAAGTRVRMYMDNTQYEKLAKQDLPGALGGWATFDQPAQSVFQMRQGMALPERFKGAGPFYVVELEVTKPMPASVGFIAPQPGNGTGGGVHAVEPAKYAGGGTQIQLPSWQTRADYLRVVQPPKCVGKGC